MVSIARRLWADADFTAFSAYDLLHAKGSPFFALLYAELFWPRFVVFEGMVFVPWALEDDDDRASVLAELARSDRTNVEQAFNFTEVSSLFGNRKGDTLPEEDRLLAEHIASMWTARLRSEPVFADTVVEIVEADEATEVGLVLFRKRT